MKSDIWKRMIRRYAIASAIGLVICAVLFTKLANIPAGQPIPGWLLPAIVVGGLLLFGGLFGIAVSVFFRILGGQKP